MVTEVLKIHSKCYTRKRILWVFDCTQNPVKQEGFCLSILVFFLFLFLGSRQEAIKIPNKLLPSSKNPHFQNDVKCTTFLVKMSHVCTRMKNHFHIKGWALNLVLIQRPGGTRKWSIENTNTHPERVRSQASEHLELGNSREAFHDHSLALLFLCWWAGLCPNISPPPPRPLPHESWANAN